MTAPDWRAEEQEHAPGKWDVWLYDDGHPIGPVAVGEDEKTAKTIAAAWMTVAALEKAANDLETTAAFVEEVGWSGTAEGIRNDAKPIRALLASLEETE